MSQLLRRRFHMAEQLIIPGKRASSDRQSLASSRLPVTNPANFLEPRFWPARESATPGGLIRAAQNYSRRKPREYSGRSDPGAKSRDRRVVATSRPRTPARG